MSNHELNAFRQQNVEEIVMELQLADTEFAAALVDLRPSAGQSLRQRIQRLTKADTAVQPTNLHQGQRFPGFVLRVGAVILLLIVAVLLTITAVPSVRAAVGRLFQQRFGLVLFEPSPDTYPATVIESNGPEMVEVESQAEVIETTISSLNLEEAQAQVDFTIPLPTSLPEGFTLWKTRVGPGPHGSSMDEEGNSIETPPIVQIILAFKPDEAHQVMYHADATVSLTIFDQTDMEGGYGVPVGSEIEVEVDGKTAVFVRGIWELLDEVATPGAGNLVWDSSADAGMLSWEADGFTYILQASHLELSTEDFIRIAESVR